MIRPFGQVFKPAPPRFATQHYLATLQIPAREIVNAQLGYTKGAVQITAAPGPTAVARLVRGPNGLSIVMRPTF